MRPRRRSEPDPLEREIEDALDPGAFISDGECCSFTSGLDGVAAKIRALSEADPARAVALFDTFIAACCEKAEEIDDSSGSFGETVEELYCDWIKARQASGADPDDTIARLVAWIDADEYGFCSDLEKSAAKVLDKAGMAAFERHARARLAAAAKTKPASGGSFRDHPDYLRRRWGDLLGRLYLAQKNVAAYVSLAEEVGLAARDCHAVATLLAERGKAKEALAWVERGLDLAGKTPSWTMDGDDLAKLRRALLTKVGRGGEALEDAWAEYREHPNTYTYENLMRLVPKARRAGWHEKALEATEGADLGSVMDLFVETKELARLAGLVRRSTDAVLEGVGQHSTEPAAKKLEKPHPELAARLWRAQGMRVVGAGKSSYYREALASFAAAKRCYERAGLAAEWKKTVTALRAEHGRKRGFMSGFENLVAGSVPLARPSFLERARERWRHRQR
jgi:hypothetical protein